MTKILGLEEYAPELRSLGNDGIIAICGVLLHRSLGRLDRRDVNTRLIRIMTEGKNHRVKTLASKLFGYVGEMYAGFHTLYPWSMDGKQLKKFIEKNKSFSKTVEDWGLNLGGYNAITLAGAIYSLRTDGAKAFIGSQVPDIISKGVAGKVGAAAGKTLGYVYLLAAASLTFAKIMADASVESGEAEIKKRQAAIR